MMVILGLRRLRIEPPIHPKIYQEGRRECYRFLSIVGSYEPRSCDLPSHYDVLVEWLVDAECPPEAYFGYHLLG